MSLFYFDDGKENSISTKENELLYSVLLKLALSNMFQHVLLQKLEPVVEHGVTRCSTSDAREAARRRCESSLSVDWERFDTAIWPMRFNKGALTKPLTVYLFQNTSW